MRLCPSRLSQERLGKVLSNVLEALLMSSCCMQAAVQDIGKCCSLSKVAEVKISSAVLFNHLQEYAAKFEREQVRLHVLLGMDHDGLRKLGIDTFGERETIINGVYEYLRAYLRAAEPFSAAAK